MGSAYQAHGDFWLAAARYNQAIALSKGLEDRYGEAVDLGNLGTIYAAQGQPQQALACYQQAQSILELCDEPQALAMTYGNAGETLVVLGDRTLGIEYLQRRIEYLRKIGHSNSVTRF